MSELPRVFTVLDEINELYRELTHSLRTNRMPTSEERVARLFAIAKQQAMDIYALEAVAAPQSGTADKLLDFSPSMSSVSQSELEAMLIAPTFSARTSEVLKVRIRELYKNSR